MRYSILTSVIVASALVVGCERKETKPEPQAAPAAAQQPGQPAQPGATDRLTQGLSDTATQVQGQAAGATEKLTSQAGTQIDQAMQYVKENKLDLAEKALNQAEQYKAQLPEALQSKLSTARKMLDDAKAKQTAPAAP